MIPDEAVEAEVHGVHRQMGDEMNERDELTELIRANRTPWVTNTEHRKMEEAQADAILAAGYRKAVARVETK